MKNMTSYAAILRNTLKFSLAPSALAIKTLKFSLKQLKNSRFFRLSLGRTKNGRFLLWRAEKLSTCLGVGGSPHGGHPILVELVASKSHKTALAVPRAADFGLSWR